MYILYVLIIRKNSKKSKQNSKSFSFNITNLNYIEL